MQDSTSLNLISAYSDSDSSDDGGASAPQSAGGGASAAQDAQRRAASAAQELQVAPLCFAPVLCRAHPPPTSSRCIRTSSSPLISHPSYQVKVQRAIHHSLSTGRKFNDQLRSHTEFRNPAIATQLAARFNVVPHDSNLNKSAWNPRALDEEGT